MGEAPLTKGGSCCAAAGVCVCVGWYGLAEYGWYITAQLMAGRAGSVPSSLLAQSSQAPGGGDWRRRRTGRGRPSSAIVIGRAPLRTPGVNGGGA